MAEISATLVKALRDRTGAGVIACKNALATAIITRPGRVPPDRVVGDITGGRRVRAAGEATISSVTGYAAGLVAPVALPDGIPVYVDQALADSADGGTVVYTATGESGTALGIGLADLLAVCAAKPAALTGRQ